VRNATCGEEVAFVDAVEVAGRRRTVAALAVADIAADAVGHIAAAEAGHFDTCKWLETKNAVGSADVADSAGTQKLAVDCHKAVKLVHWNVLLRLVIPDSPYSEWNEDGSPDADSSEYTWVFPLQMYSESLYRTANARSVCFRVNCAPFRFAIVAVPDAVDAEERSIGSA
jgi:hypothetical protein